MLKCCPKCHTPVAFIDEEVERSATQLGFDFCEDCGRAYFGEEGIEQERTEVIELVELLCPGCRLVAAAARARGRPV
jgi:uncharacterized protein YbaR (Trm112 family)